MINDFNLMVRQKFQLIMKRGKGIHNYPRLSSWSWKESSRRSLQGTQGEWGRDKPFPVMRIVVEKVILGWWGQVSCWLHLRSDQRTWNRRIWLGKRGFVHRIIWSGDQKRGMGRDDGGCSLQPKGCLLLLLLHHLRSQDHHPVIQHWIFHCCCFTHTIYLYLSPSFLIPF